jgi:hypothetical protein
MIAKTTHVHVVRRLPDAPRQTALPTISPNVDRVRRVSWENPDDLEAVVLAALGFPAKQIQKETGMTTSRVYYRCKRAGVKITDYRYKRSGTIGGEMAGAVLNEVKRRYTAVVQRKLPALLPPKKAPALAMGPLTSGDGRQHA